jgi:CO/xanthine dehydrogenase Mo-binding subunit
VQIDSYMVYTNSVPCGHMRSPAKPQVGFAVESHMDMIAQELGMDPYELRLRNILKPGDTSPIGEAWQDIRAEETLRQAAQAAGWGEPKKSPSFGRGMAIADQTQGSGQSTATVSIEGTGQVTLFMSLWDTGTGASTIMRQVVAEALTVPVEDVGIVIRDTDAVDFESGPGGSRVTYTAGQAVLGAANELKERLSLLAAEYLSSPVELIRQEADGQFFVSGQPEKSLTVNEVASRAVSATGQPLTGTMTHTSAPSEVTSYAAQVAEVEVDRDTGEVIVKKIYTVHDVGTILNPITHQGQIEGGVIQGLGYALMEEIISEEGQVSTLSLGDYKIPTMPDIPELETRLLEPSAGQAPYQTKGIGENSNIPVAGAIANAVYDAVGVRILDLPITAEKVLKALKAQRDGI